MCCTLQGAVRSGRHQQSEASSSDTKGWFCLVNGRVKLSRDVVFKESELVQRFTSGSLLPDTGPTDDGQDPPARPAQEEPSRNSGTSSMRPIPATPSDGDGGPDNGLRAVPTSMRAAGTGETI